MLRDPHVRQSISYVSDPLRCALWRFRPAGQSALHVEQADFATWAFVEQLKWDQIIRLAVTGYCADGFALLEMCDDVRPIPADRFRLHPGGGAGIVPTGLFDVPANTVYRWRARPGAPAEVESIQQWQPFSDSEANGYRDIAAAAWFKPLIAKRIFISRPGAQQEAT